MATFTLDNLREEVSRKYAPTVIENGDDAYTLPNLLQMPSKQRKEVLDLIDKFEDSGSGDYDAQFEVFSEIIEAGVEGGKGKELLELLGDNAALVVEIVTSWMEGTQAGEAEPSSES